MRIGDYSTNKEQTVRILLDVDGEECFIEVYGITSRKYSEAYAWFKRACSEKMMSGAELITTEEVAGEQIAKRSDDYDRLQTILFAHLIADWGFEDELNLSNATSLLTNNPHLCTKIDEETSMMAYAEATAKKPQSKPLEEK